MESVRAAGFKTTGSPSWIWHTQKPAVLNKLRDLKPKSGLTITELAFEKYKFLNDQETRKQELKKEFLNRKKQHEQSKDTWPEYDDPETGLRCKKVAPLETEFVMQYTPPPAPELSCFMCGSPLYLFDYSDLCLWCSK